MLTEAPLNPRQNRDVAAQIFFETFNVPAFFTSVQAVLSLYSTGRTTGIVLDSGDGVTHAVPVFEGFSMPHAIQRIDLAGRDVTDHLQLLLRKAGHYLHTSAEKEVVRTIKEKTCYLSANPVKEEKDHAGAWEEFRLPDGKVIQLGTERFLAPEILFNPELVGQEYPGVHQVIVDSINRTDMDLRKALFSNIVLSGGSTLCTGECGLCCRILTLRLWRQAAQRGQEDCAQGRQAQDLRATRTKVLDLDWRQYPRGPEHIQEDVGLGRRVQGGPGHHPQEGLLGVHHLQGGLRPPRLH